MGSANTAARSASNGGSDVQQNHDRSNTDSGHVSSTTVAPTYSVLNSSAEATVSTTRTDKHKGEAGISSAVDTLDKGSEEVFDICCDICKGNGNNTEAEAKGYCKDCTIYLCWTCFNEHKTKRSFKNHALLDENNMPKLGRNSNKLSETIMEGSDAIKSPSFTGLDYHRSLNVSGPNDRQPAMIFSMSMLTPSRLAMADYLNTSVKIMDMKTETIVDEIQTLRYPLSMAVIPQSNEKRIVVVVPIEHKVQIFTTSTGLKEETRFQIKGVCLAAMHTNGNILLSFGKPLIACNRVIKFEIYNVSGELLRRLPLDPAVEKICTFPFSIAEHPNRNSFYVSDQKKNSLLLLDLNGKLLADQKSSGMYQPHAICVAGDGSVYVCDKNNLVILQLQPGLDKQKVMLVPDDKIHFPVSLCYWQEEEIMLVGSSDVGSERTANKLNMYKFS